MLAEWLITKITIFRLKYHVEMFFLNDCLTKYVFRIWKFLSGKVWKDVPLRIVLKTLFVYWSCVICWKEDFKCVYIPNYKCILSVPLLEFKSVFIHRAGNMATYAEWLTYQKHHLSSLIEWWLRRFVFPKLHKYWYLIFMIF